MRFLCVCIAALVTLPARGIAEPRPVDARVVWVRADCAYIAATDSVALAPGDLLTMMKGKKAVASGTVLQVFARDLVEARLTSGSLDRTKLDRLRVLAERPPLRPIAMLRIGYPGRGRVNLLFECARPVPRAPAGAAYYTDSLAENAWRFTRGAAAAEAAPWPDTIAVRLFGEASDEEIALERGELDVAVFWPGEASSRLRADPRWQGLSYGARGVLAASLPAGASITPDDPALVALNADLFRGDLAPWHSAGTRSAPSAPPRFIVDPSSPGRAAIERFLGRGHPAMGTDTIRLFYASLPGPQADSSATPLFAVRCAIAIEPGLRAYVEALGADSIAEMLICSSPGRTP